MPPRCFPRAINNHRIDEPWRMTLEPERGTEIGCSEIVPAAVVCCGRRADDGRWQRAKSVRKITSEQSWSMTMGIPYNAWPKVNILLIQQIPSSPCLNNSTVPSGTRSCRSARIFSPSRKYRKPAKIDGSGGTVRNGCRLFSVPLLNPWYEMHNFSADVASTNQLATVPRRSSQLKVRLSGASKQTSPPTRSTPSCTRPALHSGEIPFIELPEYRPQWNANKPSVFRRINKVSIQEPGSDRNWVPSYFKCDFHVRLSGDFVLAITVRRGDFDGFWQFLTYFLCDWLGGSRCNVARSVCGTSHTVRRKFRPSSLWLWLLLCIVTL